MSKEFHMQVFISDDKDVTAAQKSYAFMGVARLLEPVLAEAGPHVVTYEWTRQDIGDTKRLRLTATVATKGPANEDESDS